MESGFDFEAMMKMMQLMQSQPFQGYQKPKEEQPFDSDSSTRTLLAIQAAIPHLEFKYQKAVAIFVKLIEINRLIEMYSNESDRSIYQDENWRIAMLNSTKEFFDPDTRQKIEMLLRFMELKGLISVLEELGYGKN